VRHYLSLVLAFGCFIATISSYANEDQLASWRDTASKQRIVDFVSAVTDANSSQFVPPAERIATFDNDGTLWAEQPLYFQALFAMDRVQAMAPEHPEWKTQEPFAALLKGDKHAALAGGAHSLLDIIMASHAGMTTAQFTAVVNDWLREARHPNTGKAYTAMVYQPMLELLAYLRANGFKTFIVSGGGIDFMRPWVEDVYGIPPEQVVGSGIELTYELIHGVPVLSRLPEMNFIDDKAGKPVGIHRHIGRRPILAVGNSDGDFEMLQWTTAGEGARLGVFIHHTDAEREWAYDRKSVVGKLDRGLNEAADNGWLIVDMARDWDTVFPQ
jgi:hypothetical protein